MTNLGLRTFKDSRPKTLSISNANMRMLADVWTLVNYEKYVAPPIFSLLICTLSRPPFLNDVYVLNLSSISSHTCDKLEEDT